MTEISEEHRELLRKRWAEYGSCRTCGWHSAYYEVQDYLEGCILSDDIESDGSIWIACHRDEDDDEEYSHRGSNIYEWKLENK